MVETHLDRDRYVMGDASDHVGFLNIERITDRRHIHGWHVDPHFHEGLAQLFVFECAGIEARIDYEPLRLDEPAVLWLPPLCSHGFDYPEEADGWVLTVPSSDVTRIATGRSWLERWIHAPKVLRASDAPEAMRDCAALARNVGIEGARQGEERNIVLESLFLLLLVQLHRGLQRAAAEPDSGPDRRQHLLNRFHGLLDQHLQQTRSVADYAAMLSVTPTHLSRSIKSVCGRTAGEIIHDRVMLAAKRELVFTDKSVTQIAYDLQFSTPSYFTRFFVQQEGETPRRFRDRMRAPETQV
ncbi:AraC family transcriptional regulator [Pseudooceanicola sp. 200-1SW]|uniref:AraC family transcriptional regulator n=1 Tax=Pseudooceanicola sp. 200-1SW TaxID=3425949 RepID=UPI003D7F77EE